MTLLSLPIQFGDELLVGIHFHAKGVDVFTQTPPHWERRAFRFVGVSRFLLGGRTQYSGPPMGWEGELRVTEEGCKLWLDFAGLDLEVIAQSVEVEESATDSLPQGFVLPHSSVLTGLPVPVDSSDVAEEPIAYGSVYAMTWESESAGPRVWLRTGQSQFYCVDFERITELDMDISIAQSLPGSVGCHRLGPEEWSIQGAEAGCFRIHARALVNLAISTPAFPEDQDL